VRDHDRRDVDRALSSRRRAVPRVHVPRETPLRFLAFA
jgi:hypothetical protein